MMTRIILFFCFLFLLAEGFTQVGPKNKPFGFMTLNPPVSVSFQETIKDKNDKIKELHTILKGGIWDEIIPNMLYVPPAGYYVVFDGTDSLNRECNKSTTTFVTGSYLLNTEITNKMYRFFLEDSTDVKYQYHIYNDTTDIAYGVFTKFKIKDGIKNGYMGDNYPVIGISAVAAIAFCNWLNQKMYQQLKGTTTHFKYMGFRLPTEAELEKAIIMNEMPERFSKRAFEKVFSTSTIANQKKEFNYGMVKDSINNIIREYGMDGYEFINPVKAFSAGSLGFYGLRGNVAEWVHDFFSPNRLCKKDSFITQNTTEKYRVVKGGSWADNAFYLQPCTRQKLNENKGSFKIGFRICMTDLEGL